VCDFCVATGNDVQFAGESGTLTFAQDVRKQELARGRVARNLAILLLLAAVAGVLRSGAALAQSEGSEARTLHS